MTVVADRSSTAAAAPEPETPRHPALAALLAGGAPAREAVDRFLADHAFPLVEPGAATFVWRGGADAVRLLRWIHGGTDVQTFERIEGTDLWTLRLPVADGGRFEYKLDIARDGGGEWINDPLNPELARDPFGANSVCMAWGYERPDWSKPSDAPEGRLEPLEIESRAFGELRAVQIYAPAAEAPEGGFPLLVIHDGEDFATYADLVAVLDNLIAEGAIPPVVAVLTQARDRMREYVISRRHARFLMEELLPAVEAAYPVSSDPAKRVLMGASLGAAASLSTAWRARGAFDRLILKSGSFVLDGRLLKDRHPVFARIARFLGAMRRTPGRPAARVFVSAGEYEGLFHQNRALARFLRGRGVEVLFKSAWDGHHWHNWRDQLRDGLVWTLAEDAKAP